jgi:hypothetical protein
MISLLVTTEKVMQFSCCDQILISPSSLGKYDKQKSDLISNCQTAVVIW